MNKYSHDYLNIRIHTKENLKEEDFLNAGFKIDKDPDYDDFYIREVVSNKHTHIGGGPLRLGTFFRSVSDSKGYILLDQNRPHSKDEWEIFEEILTSWEESGFMIQYEVRKDNNQWKL